MESKQGETLSRRALLFGRKPKGSEVETFAPVLPWADPQAILNHCVRCGDCAAACPEQIIKAAPNGFPAVDFTLGECSFCQKCSDVCAEPVFVTHEKEVPLPAWDLKAQITDECLALKGVACQICQDQCGVRAIRFPPRLGAAAVPVIDDEACTGCGACVASCPADSIRILKPVSARHQEEVSLD